MKTKEKTPVEEIVDEAITLTAVVVILILIATVFKAIVLGFVNPLT